jgi:hypothetical protein
VVSVIRAGNWQFSANRASVNLKTPFPVTGMGFEEYQKKTLRNSAENSATICENNTI